MSAFGPGITPGTRALSVTPTTVTLTADVTAKVLAGSAVTFGIIPSTLADQIAAWLPGTTVATLKQVTAAQWTSFFAQPGSPQWLPPFTQPVAPGASSGQPAMQAGYVATRIRAFVRAVQQFFTVSSVATTAQLPPAGAAATFEPSAYDPIVLAAGGITFGAGALIGPGPGHRGAERVSWRPRRAGLAGPGDDDDQRASGDRQRRPAPPVTAGYTLPYPVSFSFSVMEALYARGFQGAADIMALPEADFQQALTGTVAYDSYDALYGKARDLAPARLRPASPAGYSSRSTPTGPWWTASRRRACHRPGLSPTCRRC